jgi:linoleoyl-CoA desaturase
MWRQFRRDYLAWPLAAGVLALVFTGSPSTAGQWALAVLAGNAVAGLIRNFWAFAIIFCGHFTEHIYTFAKNSTEGESKGQWYLRQILGSSNIRGGRLLHLMSGNLSHQI